MNLEKNAKMMTNKEKFKSLVSDEKSTTVSRNKERIKNRARLRASQDIALKVLNKLEVLGWSQRKLAEALDVSPQQITKIVKGKENLTLETQVKLQQVLDIPILASYYESKAQSVTFDEVINLDVAVTAYKTLPTSGTSFYKKEMTEKYHPKPQMVVVSKSFNYLNAS